MLAPSQFRAEHPLGRASRGERVRLRGSWHDVASHDRGISGAAAVS